MRNHLMAIQNGVGKTQRVVFGPGVRHSASDVIREMGCSRALLLSTPQQSQMAMQFASELSSCVPGIFTRAKMHTPIEITEEAVA